MKKAVFLDRDGVINRNVPNLTKVEQFELIDESVSKAIKQINDAGHFVVLVTNQPVVAKGFCSMNDIALIHDKMNNLLNDAKIDAIYICPHHPEKGFSGEVKELKIDCLCRKPKPGLILKAAQEHDIDLSNSWIIGDSVVDVAAGQSAGVKTILIKGDGNGSKDEKCLNNIPDVVVNSLSEAVNFIFGGQK